MPLPMVHLLLAEKIGEKTGKEPDACFLLGSIAPDAIHMRPHTNRQDKHRTHFFGEKRWDAKEVQLHWDNVMQRLATFQSQNAPERSFKTGYCLHTLLDSTWIYQIFNVLAQTLRAGDIGFEDIRNKYYAETNICDAFLYRQSSWSSQVRHILETVNPLAFAPLLTAEEIGLWRTEVLHKMDQYEKAAPKETFYITDSSIQKLTEALAGKIIASFSEKGYALL